MTIYFPDASIDDVLSAGYSYGDITFNNNSKVSFNYSAPSTYRFSNGDEYIYSEGSLVRK